MGLGGQAHTLEDELDIMEDNLDMTEDDLDMMEDDPKMYKIYHYFKLSMLLSINICYVLGSSSIISRLSSIISRLI